jgi:hypothetical protein
MTTTSLKALLLAALLASFRTVSLAELPPYVYKERQQQAPESLIIKVGNVKMRETDEPRGKKINVSLEAQVEQVKRTETGLKVGDVIRINYVHSQSACWSKRSADPQRGASLSGISDEVEEGEDLCTFGREAIASRR